LHDGDVRRVVRDHRHQPCVVDFAQREPHAGRGRRVPAETAVCHAVAGVAARDRRSHRAVDFDSRTARPRRGGGHVSTPNTTTTPSTSTVSTAGTPSTNGTASASPAISADHLSKWYGQVIGLNDVSVTVPPGVTGLLGPNGAGKSTFMKLITGQL